MMNESRMRHFFPIRKIWLILSGSRLMLRCSIDPELSSSRRPADHNKRCVVDADAEETT